MSITTHFDDKTNTLTFRFDDHFDFSVHKVFYKAIEQISDKAKVIELDLSRTDYMDSASLGMLLILHEAKKNFQTVKITHVKPALRKILEVANFQQLFIIE